MGNKNKTISFRVNEDAFEALQAIAEERDISLSAVFRDYVDRLVEHDGQVEVVPEAELEARTGGAGDDEEISFPPTVEVPKRFIREHERLELEAEHLREQLDEYKGYVNDLQDRLEDEEDEVLLLDELDDEDGSYQLR
ncbi:MULTISPECIES: ribbon-helix-helix protein, CopG family [Natrinema]|uniref:CopG domain protein DNA-binding domain protein n=1 Tax=Natrinema gari JCM 14663 TaxID=1230459 RepID=L9YV12_9EURY|nr:MULTISPECIES: ribbon-helix-helix protein, CopG family [Natrinema]AFO59460.1 CopG domain protein DNA-binding domain protein [Natrinema sp. J7-2]ELY77964.1 CopG domain protein DNA-binding domain protein [Natrinema gari JCM 14663]